MEPTAPVAGSRGAALGTADSPDSTGSVRGPRAGGASQGAMTYADVARSGRTTAPSTMGRGARFASASASHVMMSRDAGAGDSDASVRGASDSASVTGHVMDPHAPRDGHAPRAGQYAPRDGRGSGFRSGSVGGSGGDAGLCSSRVQGDSRIHTGYVTGPRPTPLGQGYVPMAGQHPVRVQSTGSTGQSPDLGAGASQAQGTQFSNVQHNWRSRVGQAASLRRSPSRDVRKAALKLQEHLSSIEERVEYLAQQSADAVADAQATVVTTPSRLQTILGQSAYTTVVEQRLQAQQEHLSTVVQQLQEELRMRKQQELRRSAELTSLRAELEREQHAHKSLQDFVDEIYATGQSVDLEETPTSSPLIVQHHQSYMKQPPPPAVDYSALVPGTKLLPTQPETSRSGQSAQPAMPPQPNLQQPVAYAAPPQRSPFAQIQMKPREPTFYRGDLNEDLQAWVSSLRDYLYLVGATDAQAVAYTATLLQGNARIWWDAYLTEHHQIRPRSLETFIEALEQRFLSPMYEKEARVKLWHISQRKEESVHAFSARFQNLLARLPHYDEEDMQERFIRALHPQLRMPVAQREPQGLSETIRLASHLELLTATYVGTSPGDGFSMAQQRRGQASAKNRGRNRVHRAPRQQQQPSGQRGQGNRAGGGQRQGPQNGEQADGGVFQDSRGRGGQSGGRGQTDRTHARLNALAGDNAQSDRQQRRVHFQDEPLQGNA